ncbi:ubiquitin-like small modifier protein 1 [Halegenticoccus soli]|uniref:ubiquitin-like small modifier protein 1 n=1 Tax=Halegenticoccus soli TaxID=1985678 RepID=UPI000C6CEA1A|nr:ubiquitin-like small modifier protein 1 [Halegenticoccus soli]
MQVEYNFFGPMRDAVGTKTVRREVPTGATVGEALRAVCEEFDGLEPHLFEDGDLLDRVTVTVNARNVRQLDGAETTLADGDVLRLAPPVVGGGR